MGSRASHLASSAEWPVISLAQRRSGIAAPGSHRRLASAAVLSVLAALIAGPHRIQAAQYFPTHVDYATSPYPESVAAGDLNGDGRLDIVWIGASQVGVLLNNGDGTFAPGATYTAGGGGVAHTVAIADLNGDGKQDVVTSFVSVLLGNGDGSLRTPVEYFMGPRNPTSLAVGDVNGDGKPDVVVSNFGLATLSVLIGVGDGTLTPTVDVPTAYQPVSVSIARLNADANPDLIAMHYGDGGGFSVHLGVGAGAFGPNVSDTLAVHPNVPALADLNGDGDVDVVGTDLLHDRVWVVLGNGDATFTAPTFDDCPDYPLAPAVADIDGDGRLDVAAVCGSLDLITVRLGNGDGTFGSAVNAGTGHGPQDLVAADLNGDGAPDLVTPNVFGSSVSVLLNARPVSGVVLPGAAIPPGCSMMGSIAPNPLRTVATISFSLSRPGRVDVDVLDVAGRKLRSLLHGAELATGEHRSAWDRRDGRGETLSAGIYFVRVRAGNRTESRRVLVLD